jgi:hypothetical protein
MNKEEATEMFVQMLGENTALTTTLKGRRYNGKRSDGRETEECIVVNTPWANHRRPQEGYTNINIHVPDETHTIDGVQQLQPNQARMSELTNLVLAVLAAKVVTGVDWQQPQENGMVEPQHNEHYNNLRVDWINCN